MNAIEWSLAAYFRLHRFSRSAGRVGAVTVYKSWTIERAEGGYQANARVVRKEAVGKMTTAQPMMAPWVEGVCAAGRRPPAGTEAGLITSVLFGLKFRSVAVACAISFVPKRGKALSSQTAHGHQAPRPSVFAQDDGRRTEPATTELRRMVPRVGARPNAA